MSKVAAIITAAAILGLSYLRHTYFISFSIQEGVNLLPINFVQDQLPHLVSIYKAQTIIWFTIACFIVNTLFLFFFFKSRQFVLLHTILFLSLSVISVFFIYLGESQNWVFMVGASIKNFILSPIYTLVMFLIAKQFHRIVQKSVKSDDSV